MKFVKDKKKIKANLIKFGEGFRKVAMGAATHPVTFAILIVAIDKTAVMINRAMGMRKDGSWRAKHFKKNDETLAFLSDITVNLGTAAAAAPVIAGALNLVQTAVAAKKGD